MRKVFLSLAALAFVATGSLTMTSCGGNDDNTPVVPNPNPNPNPDPNPNPNPDPNNPVDENKAINVDGDLYGVDILESFVGSNDERTAIKVYDITLTNNTTLRATKWIMTAYNGDDAMTAPNYYETTIYIEVGENDAVITPAAAESFIIGGAPVVYAGDANTALNYGTPSNFRLGFDTYVESTETALGSITFGQIFNTTGYGEITFLYTGDMDGTYLIPDQPASPRGLSANKSNKVNVSDLATVDGGKIKLNNSIVIKR